MLYSEYKKNPRLDLSRMQPLIFSISLTVTMVLANFAFNWKFYDNPDTVLKQKNKNDFEEIMDIPPTEIKPPAPAAIRTPSIIEVPDEQKIEEDVKIKLDLEMTTETVMSTFTNETIEPPKMDVEETDKIFVIVEQTAAPRDGMASFYKYVSENIKYPPPALRMGIEGRVFVQFVVNRDGSLSDFEVIKGVGSGCDEEAIRIIKNSPPWSPGKQRGKAVRQRMVLPIFFQLAR